MNSQWISTRWTVKRKYKKEQKGNSVIAGKEKDDWIRDLYFTNIQTNKCPNLMEWFICPSLTNNQLILDIIRNYM